MKNWLIALSVMAFSSIVDGKEKELRFVKLSDNVYQHISYKYVKPWGMVGATGLIYVDGKHAHVIDTPWSLEDTQKLAEWIKSKGLELKSNVVTHFHEDASGGISYFNQHGVDTYALSLTNKLLESIGRERASHEFNDSYALAGGKVEVFYPGPGHSQDNVVVWMPREQILFTGCFGKSLSSKNLGYVGDASIEQWPASVDKLLSRYSNAKIVVPGHGKVGDLTILKHTKNLANLAHANNN